MPGQFCAIAPNIKLGRDATIHHFVNLYGREIGDGTRIGSFVEIQKALAPDETAKFQATRSFVKG